MTDYCSSHCDKYEGCTKLGITDFMKVIPKRPHELKKNWCESYEEKAELCCE